MKTRHVVAIGILTAIAVGLLAIGIKITGQKPKVQTNAYYQIDSYNYTNKNFTISGQPDRYYTGHTIEYTSAFTTATGSYFIEKTGLTLNTTIEFSSLISEDYSYGDNQPINEIVRLTQIVDARKEIKTINIIQNSVDSYEIENSDNLLWVYNYNTKITYTDNTNSSSRVNYFEVELNPYETIYLEEVDTPYIWETIEINNTLNTLDYTYQTGYTTGYQNKGDLADGNFVSIQETMLNVLTMPFTFISQGFNVTLWEGTPYAINIGNFIKSLIAIATILFIIKMFTSGFSVIGNYTTGTGNNISQWSKNRSERKLNESKARLNDRTNPNHKSRDSHVTIKKE